MVVRAKKKPIIEQIATAQNDITRSYIGRVLVNPDKVLSAQSAGKGVEIYEDMLYEARVFSEMQKRKLAVIGKEWEVVPASDSPQDQKIAEFVDEVFKKFSYDTSRQALLSGIVTGFKPGEIMWDYSEGDIWIKEIKGISPRRFAFDVENNLRLLTWADMINGEPVPERKFLVFTNPSDNSSPYGDGLGRPLYWPIWFKKNGIKFWAVFLDKFGQPTPWGKYPSGTEKAKQDDLLDALKAMQTDQAIITPDSMTVELLEAARASSVDSYDRWEKFWNDAITFIILGQTATTEGTPGKLGEETARSDIRQEIVKADADLLCECQNTFLIPWVVDYNFPGVTEYPKVWIRTEPEKDLKGLADRDILLIRDLKLPTPLSYLYDTYGIPQPEEGEELVSLPTPVPSLPFGFAENRRTRSPGAQFVESEDLWIEAYLKRISPSLRQIKGSALKDIEIYLRKQSSPPSQEEFIKRLQDILGDNYKKIDLTAVSDAVADVYKNYKLVEKAIEVAYGFGGADIRAINFLAKIDHFYLSRFIENPDAVSTTTEFLKTRYLEGGEGLFGAGDPKAIAELKNLLSQHMTDLEGYQVRRIVETAVQRDRNWAHISQMHDGGIAEIEIVEPTQECPFCASMDGQIIQVDIAYSKMLNQSAMTPEEYEMELKNNVPQWDDSTKSFNVEDYLDQGLLPPYHPHCRGRIIKRIEG